MYWKKKTIKKSKFNLSKMISKRSLSFFVEENSKITYLRRSIKAKDPLLITLKSMYPKKNNTVIRYALSLIRNGWKKQGYKISEKYITEEKKNRKKKIELLEISLISPKSPYFNSFGDKNCNEEG
ncbi:MAG: hypothetical protein CVT89_01105 [Candidatus Altiarchaeales archaeon HGW-Altiarchaeales-2]|nr:MAG: hypothetical protein CVT89_01105 [Candidatus Altiarchaeales archaeon HGW-Altiarchaeales-2]